MSEKQKPGQFSMFDLDSRELNPDFVDPNTKLIVYRKPLHFKAHKLQILIERLDKQSVSSPAQFNSRNYIDALTELENCMSKINQGLEDETNDEGGVAQDRVEGSTAAMGQATPSSVGAGVSADNPFAG